MDQDKFLKWRNLVGDTNELNNPAFGNYAGGISHTGYPTVIRDPTAPLTAQTNRPSIFGRDIHVPLGFWFTEDWGKSIPLIGLQSHEVEVQLTLNPITELYTVLDASGYRVNPEWVVRAPEVDIAKNQPAYVATSDVSGNIRFFYTDFGPNPPGLNALYINPRLQGTFIYLPKDEQQIFASKPLAYIYRQVTPYPFVGVTKRDTYDIQTHNPITRLIMVPRRSDAGQRNDFANFTNWVNYPLAPFNPTPTVPAYLQQGNSSGIQIPNSQLEIIRSIRVLCDGNEIQEQKSGDFFTQLVPYRYVKGIGQDGLALWSFELNEDPLQPAGSINASRIRNFQVEVDVWPPPVNSINQPTYGYDFTIYVENYNWFEVASGMGGIKYAL
jgi:hypothetical protein